MRVMVTENWVLVERTLLMSSSLLPWPTKYVKPNGMTGEG